jgi:hypothetical protein
MPDVTKAATSTSAKGAREGLRQSSNEVLMVAPTAFGFNEQAAQVMSGIETQTHTPAFWNQLAQVLRALGLHVFAPQSLTFEA